MNLKNKKILVTGGAGFIGSHIVESLLNKGAKITVYDNFSSGFIENLDKNKKEIEVIRGDILDFEKLKKAILGKDIVSHQAAHLEILKSVSDPVEDLTNNTIGSLNVFKACLLRNVERVMVASSACVYGQAQYTPQGEDHPKNPNWEYGVSKYAVEKYSDIFVERYGMNITNLRYSIVYGPKEWYGRVLTIFLKRAMEGKPLIIFGDGKQERDFVFIEDVVRLHNLCLEKDIKRGEIFNASTGISTTTERLAKKVKKIINKDIEIVFENVKEGEISKFFNRVRLISELRQMVLDNQKAKKILSWKPEVILVEGLKREYEWLLDNKHMWKRMSV